MFKIYSCWGDQLFDIEYTKFSDGCYNVLLDDSNISTELDNSFPSVLIQWDVEDATEELVKLMLIRDALNRTHLGDKHVKLSVGYFPQARADRVFGRGMPHPLKVYADVINNMNFHTVFVSDPHSDVLQGVVNNLIINNQVNIFRTSKNSIVKLLGHSDYLLCSPDLGATKKTFDIILDQKHTEMVQAIKVRDTSNGNIIACGIIDDHKVKDKDIVIVDDIADGGASFKFLAKKLKEFGANRVLLMVSHGIFSKGLDALVDIDFIVCNNLLEKYINIRDIQLFNDRGEK